MSNRIIVGAAIAALLGLSQAAVAQTAKERAASAQAARDKAGKVPDNVQSIRDCMSKNLVARGALRDLGLEVYDKEGKVRSLRMRLFWKPAKGRGQRVNLRLIDPPAMAGSSYLLLQEGFK